MCVFNILFMLLLSPVHSACSGWVFPLHRPLPRQFPAGHSAAPHALVWLWTVAGSVRCHCGRNSHNRDWYLVTGKCIYILCFSNSINRKRRENSPKNEETFVWRSLLFWWVFPFFSYLLSYPSFCTFLSTWSFIYWVIHSSVLSFPHGLLFIELITLDMFFK